MSLIPSWLEQYRMDDALMAQAYDQADSAARARIKTALACYFALWPPIPDKSSLGRSLSGFDLSIQEEPAPWVLAFIAPGYSPARVLAALMPALLAKVNPVLVICDGMPESLLRTTMELAGLEDIFHNLPVEGSQSSLALLEYLQTKAPGGRALFLCHPQNHDDYQSSLRYNLAYAAASRGIPLWSDAPNPLIHVEQSPSQSKGCPVNLISELHPDARVVPMVQGVSGNLGRVSACYGQNTFDAEHHFATGLEACWLHQGLMPAWFRNNRISATFNPGDLP